MKFFSTRDHSRIVTASQAIAQGLSDEGGLFVPESFPQVDVEALCQLDYPELAAAVVSEYLTDYSKDFLAEAARTTMVSLRRQGRLYLPGVFPVFANYRRNGYDFDSSMRTSWQTTAPRRSWISFPGGGAVLL